MPYYPLARSLLLSPTSTNHATSDHPPGVKAGTVRVGGSLMPFVSAGVELSTDTPLHSNFYVNTLQANHGKFEP